MWKLIAANKIFLILVVLFWALCLVLLLSYDKASIHLMLNSFHTEFLDRFFRYYTEVGGWVPFLVGGLLLFYRFSAALFVLVPQALIALPLYVIKQFYDAPRPIAFFLQEQFQLLQVQGVNYHCTNSFPSGHTTAVFAMFVSLAVLVRNRVAKLLFVVLAISVGYSRIYLSQHFLLDVFAGSMIGVLFSLIYMSIQQHYFKAWMNMSLISLANKFR